MVPNQVAVSDMGITACQSPTASANTGEAKIREARRGRPAVRWPDQRRRADRAKYRNMTAKSRAQALLAEYLCGNGCLLLYIWQKPHSRYYYQPPYHER